MTKLQIYSNSGKATGSMEASDTVFNSPVNMNLVSETLTWYLASSRQGNASAKTRAEVSGGGKKPWRQKGTGRARVGDNRPPHWVGGGVPFPPKPRDYSFSLPIKVRKAALRSVLSDKMQAGKIKIVDTITLEAPKTKEMVKFLKALGKAESYVIVTSAKDDMVDRAARNIKGVTVLTGKALNVYDLLKNDEIIITKDAVPVIEEALK